MARTERQRLTTISDMITLEMVTRTLMIGIGRSLAGRSVVPRGLSDPMNEETAVRLVDGITFGWVNTSIAELATNAADLFVGFRVVLVTLLDSTADVSSTRTAVAIVERYPECRLSGKALVLPGARIAEIARTMAPFSGFDEVWCFDHEPPLAAPTGIRLAAPLNLDSDSLPKGMSGWIKESGAYLGLGDGIGLNFVTPQRVLAERLTSLAGA
jgi:hypothetical protein